MLPIIIVVVVLFIILTFLEKRETFVNNYPVLIVNGNVKLDIDKSKCSKKEYVIENICIKNRLGNAITIVNVNQNPGTDETFKLSIKRYNNDSYETITKMDNWLQKTTDNGLIELCPKGSKDISFPYTGLYLFQNIDNPASSSKNYSKSFQVLVE